MKILFWGTPGYAVPSLEALVLAGHELVGVVSQPDRRRGRGSTLVPSAVKSRALELGLPVLTPCRIRREPETQEQLAALGAEASVVVAFGQLLPPEVLAQPPLGCWNGHGSLLPRWRGAAPIQWCLIEGDSDTGVGIMAMEEGLDTGPVLLERRVTIDLLENATQLGVRLSRLTAELLVEAMPRIARVGPGPQAERWHGLGLKPQSREGLTQARLLQKQDAHIDWSASALAIHRRVMGLHPGAVSPWGQRRLKLLATEPLVPRLSDWLTPAGAALAHRWGEPGSTAQAEARAADPGHVLERARGTGLVVATGGCPLLIREAQLEGKRALRDDALLQQLGARLGDRLG